MTRARLYLVLMGAVFGLLSAVQMVRLMAVPREDWWTPSSQAPTPAEGADRVEILIRGEPLEKVMAEGALQLAQGDSDEPLSPGDLRLRFNNLDAERARRIPALVSYAIGLGAAAMALILGLSGLVAPRALGTKVPP